MESRHSCSNPGQSGTNPGVDSPRAYLIYGVFSCKKTPVFIGFPLSGPPGEVVTLGPILLRAVGLFAYSPPPWFKGVATSVRASDSGGQKRL